MEWMDLVQDLYIAAAFEYGNEPFGSIKCRGILD
jgi:hypothetical protein